MTTENRRGFSEGAERCLRGKSPKERPSSERGGLVEARGKKKGRDARRDGIDALKKAVKDGLAEDEQKNAEAKLQKIHDKYIKQIDDMLAEKDKEIMTV